QAEGVSAADLLGPLFGAAGGKSGGSAAAAQGRDADVERFRVLFQELSLEDPAKTPR
ncbi:MAG: hypothetical protein FJZ01_15520, partial [Candidatus Sericytochromatia bacterium]|nr:hypothetical protein [Candidatus Tanganyikabacteria bacterium]